MDAVFEARSPSTPPSCPHIASKNSKELPAGEMLTRDTHIITPTNLHHTQPLTVALTVEQALSHRPAESGTYRKFTKAYTHSKNPHPSRRFIPHTSAPRTCLNLWSSPGSTFVLFDIYQKCTLCIFGKIVIYLVHISSAYLVVHYAKVHFLKKVFPVSRKYAP